MLLLLLQELRLQNAVNSILKVMLQWRESDITKENIDEVIHFCLEGESRCINLVQYLLEERKELKKKFSILPASKTRLPFAKVIYFNEEICFVACVNRHQFFLYCVSQKIANMQNELTICHANKKKNLWTLIVDIFNFSKVYALMGEEEVQLRLKECLFAKDRLTTTRFIHYMLMTFDKESIDLRAFDKRLANEGHIICEKKNSLSDVVVTRRATIADATSLLPLQLEYEKEEVCKNQKEIPAYISMMNLQRILKDEIAYITTLDGHPIAKANTNAQGINWMQLGGVYTLPKYRSRGIGRLTVSHLMRHICHVEKKKIALFVNTENMAAISMYKRLGFVNAGNFMISYLR